MKSNICELNKDLACLKKVLSEVEKVTDYNGLEGKNALRLRLLAEELCGMLPGLVDRFSGSFWAENKGNNYELHVELVADEMDIETREELIAVSKSGKNAAAKGIMGKIRAVAETMLLTAFNGDSNGVVSDEYYDHYGNMGYGFMSTDPALDMEMGTIYSWSLCKYKNSINEKDDNDGIDELERSIVAKLADDITVGVRGTNVEIVVKKAF